MAVGAQSKPPLKMSDPTKCLLLGFCVFLHALVQIKLFFMYLKRIVNLRNEHLDLSKKSDKHLSDRNLAPPPPVRE